MNPYLSRLKVLRFGCLRDVNVSLTPLHAFIGPNDSGKSTLLRALNVGMSAAASSDSGKERRSGEYGTHIALSFPEEVDFGYDLEPGKEETWLCAAGKKRSGTRGCKRWRLWRLIWPNALDWRHFFEALA